MSPATSFAHGNDADLLLMERSIGDTRSIEVYRFLANELSADRSTGREWSFLIEEAGESCYQSTQQLHLTSRNRNGVRGLLANSEQFEDASLKLRIMPFPEWGLNLGKWDEESGQVVPVNNGAMLLVSKLGGNEVALADGSDCESDYQFLSLTKDEAVSINLDLSFRLYGSGVEDCEEGQRAEPGVYIVAVQFLAEHLDEEDLEFWPSEPVMLFFYHEDHRDKVRNVQNWLSQNALLNCGEDCRRAFKTEECEYPIGPELCFDGRDNDQDEFIDEEDEDCMPDDPIVEEPEPISPEEQTGGTSGAVNIAGENQTGGLEEGSPSSFGGSPIEEPDSTTGETGGANEDPMLLQGEIKSQNADCSVDFINQKKSIWKNMIIAFLVLIFFRRLK